jgi:hypothetical protein
MSQRAQGREPDGARNSYSIALGEARETLANLELAEARGYIRCIEPHVRSGLNHINEAARRIAPWRPDPPR